MQIGFMLVKFFRNVFYCQNFESFTELFESIGLVPKHVLRWQVLQAKIKTVEQI